VKKCLAVLTTLPVRTDEVIESLWKRRRSNPEKRGHPASLWPVLSIEGARCHGVLSTIGALASLRAGWPDADNPDADNSGTLDTDRNRTHQMRSKSQAASETAARCATLTEETDDPNKREYYARLRDAWITLAKRCEFSSISDVTDSEKF
jgi:hypothetical protein